MSSKDVKIKRLLCDGRGIDGYFSVDISTLQKKYPRKKIKYLGGDFNTE